MPMDGRIRALAKHFEISRNKVRRILRAHQSKRDDGHDILLKKQKRSSKLTPFIPMMKSLIESSRTSPACGWWKNSKTPDTTAAKPLSPII